MKIEMFESTKAAIRYLNHTFESFDCFIISAKPNRNDVSDDLSKAIHFLTYGEQHRLLEAVSVFPVVVIEDYKVLDKFFVELISQYLSSETALLILIGGENVN